MTTIYLRPAEVREKANSIKKLASSVLTAVNAVDSEVKTLGPEVYDGTSAERFRQSYNRIRSHLQAFDDLLNAFAENMTQIANDIESVDK